MKAECNKLLSLIARNIKVYFKDKMAFFLSMISPMILVVLFLTFLRGVYEDSLISSLPDGMTIDEKLVNAFAGGWLFSSILATSCITVAFCSNIIVQDKLNHVYEDFAISPIKKSTMRLSYVISNFITTLIVCLILFIVSLIYLAIVGWYLSFTDILLILADMLLSIFFGSLLMSLISLFISSQGQYSAVCTLISSMYGFICGAYMPIHSMGEGIQKFVCFLPGTYGTVIFRQGYMNGILNEIGKTVPNEVVEGIRQGFDGKISFFNINVSTLAMFIILIMSLSIITIIYLLATKIKKNHPIKVSKKVKQH